MMDTNGNEEKYLDNGITVKEAELIKEIRSHLGHQLTPLYDTDYNLRRWLIGWNYDLKKILPKLKKHLMYRKCLNLDDPVSQFKVSPFMAKYYPQCYFDHTTGRNNSLLNILWLGKVDCSYILPSTTSQDFIRARIYYTETCLRKIMDIEKATKQPCNITHILDADGLKWDQWTLKVATGPFKDLGHLLQENYCEVTNRILVVNAGNLVYTIWRFIQPFVAQRTKDKVKILSSNWREEILEYVSPENLPPQWGGTLEGWESKMVIPDKMNIPEEFCSKITEEDKLQEMYLEEKHISRNSYIYEEFYVSKPGTRIRWYFQSQSSTYFGIFFSNEKQDANNGFDSDSIEMVYPKFSVMSEFNPGKGELTCSQVGYYYLEFGSTTLLFPQSIKMKVTLIAEDDSELD